MAKFFYTLEKAFDNVTLFVKLFIEIMFYDSITFVGHTNSSSLLLNKRANFLGVESFISQNSLTDNIYCTQECNSAFGIVNLSASQNYPDKLKIFIDESVNLGVISTTRFSYRLLAQDFESTASVFMYFAESEINLNERIFIRGKIQRSLRSIHKIPLSTTLELSGGRPLLLLAGKKNSIFFH